MENLLSNLPSGDNALMKTADSQLEQGFAQETSSTLLALVSAASNPSSFLQRQFLKTNNFHKIFMENLLSNLLSGDNSLMKTAEIQLEQGFAQDPSSTLLALVSAASNPSLLRHLRGLSVVLTRRIISKHTEVWRESIPHETQARIRNALLVALSKGGLERNFRIKLCDTISIAGDMANQDGLRKFFEQFNGLNERMKD